LDWIAHDNINPRSYSFVKHFVDLLQEGDLLIGEGKLCDENEALGFSNSSPEIACPSCPRPILYQVDYVSNGFDNIRLLG
jgi:hypothetical protein